MSLNLQRNRWIVLILVTFAAVSVAARPAHAYSNNVAVSEQPVDAGVFVAPGGTLLTTGGTPPFSRYSLFAERPDLPLCELLGNTGDGWFDVGVNAQSTIDGNGELMLVLNADGKGDTCAGFYVNVGYISPAVMGAGQPPTGASASAQPTPSPTPVVQPPPVPGNFRIASSSGGVVIVAWDSNPAAMIIFDANGCGCYVDAPSGATSYSFQGVPAGERGCYIAIAQNAAGYSPWSQWACTGS